MKHILLRSVLGGVALLGAACGSPELRATPASGVENNTPASAAPASNARANPAPIRETPTTPAATPTTLGMSPSAPETGPGNIPIAPAPSGAAPETGAPMPIAPPAAGMPESPPAPPMPAPTGESCIGVSDPNFNLDVERPRGDPPARNAALPALFLVGDSTVKNHNVQQEGWGDLLDSCFDGSRMQVINWAREGRSTRSFIEDGIWAKVLSQLTPADYVMVQFGHNDQSTLDTRGTLPGTGEEFQAVVSSTTMLSVDVHSYGFYLRQYADDIRPTGAHLIYVTPVPRNYWTSETVMNNSQMAQYVGWMKDVAESEQLPLLDLNTAVVDIYTALGRTAASAFFTSGDNTHTNLMGASRVAGAVLDAVGTLRGSDLAQFLVR
jgi:rhamnogalacturonan acetylesterase